MKKWSQRVPSCVVLGLLCMWLLYGFWPQSVRVETVKAEVGSFHVTISEDGRTRIREKYTVSAPVSGKLFRILLHEGDVVEQGKTVLARIEPSPPGLLDSRARAEAEARVQAAQAGRHQADASLQRSQEAHQLARHEYARVRELIQKRAVSMAAFDEREHEERMARADLRSAEFAVAVANFELELAKAALISTLPQEVGKSPSETLTMTSPVDGKVLRVLQENAGIVSPGTSLIEIGDPRDLEMEIDVLSTDAVKIEPGARVLVEHWGGNRALEGKVRLVEPAAYRKVSALGVDEQRVNIIADFTSPFEQRESLGDAYRVEAQIVVAEAVDTLMVPAGTLFREKGKWSVFCVVNGRARLRHVEIGKSNGRVTELVAGATEGEELVLYPTDRIQDGMLVRSENAKR